MVDEENKSLVAKSNVKLTATGKGANNVLSQITSDALEIAKDPEPMFFSVGGYTFNSESYTQLEIWAREVILEGVQGTSVEWLVRLLDLKSDEKSVVDGSLKIAVFPEKTRWVHQKIDLSYASGLDVLLCRDNGLGELNLSILTNLITLHCDSNHIESLSLCGLSELEVLSCEDNQLTKLDLSHTPLLKWLYCTSNQLTELDLSQLPALEYLICHHNQLEAIDLSSNSKLKELFCHDNKLQELDLSYAPKLNKLGCSFNQLTKLDLSFNPSLEGLICDYNMLSQLNLSYTSRLRFLKCSGNQLAELDLSLTPNLERLECTQTFSPEQNLLGSIFGYNYLDSIPKQKITIGYQQPSSTELKQAANWVLASLTPREERVLRMRFGVGMDTDHTLEEVGQQLSITREQVRKVEAIALRKLKHPSRSRKLRTFLQEISVIKVEVDEKRARWNVTLDNIKSLLQLGKSRGFVTSTELNDAFGREEFPDGLVDDVISAFAEMGVSIVDGDLADEGQDSIGKS